MVHLAHVMAQPILITKAVCYGEHTAKNSACMHKEGGHQIKH